MPRRKRTGRRSRMMADEDEVGEVELKSGNVTWKIENFSSLSDMVDCNYCSPDFQFQDRLWYLKLYPNGESNIGSEGYFGLYLFFVNRAAPIRLRYSLGIQAADGKKRDWLNTTYTFGKKKAVWGIGRGIQRSELLRRRDELLPGDVLTVTATLEESGGDEKGTDEVSVLTEVGRKMADVSTQTEEDNMDSDGKMKVQEKLGGEKVLQDIEKLWVSGKNSDVVLRVKGIEFKAHRAVLIARTPLLCTMFDYDTDEKESGVVTISDCDPSVFEQLLHYIYTGFPRELKAENAAALYVVADKYSISEVKALCVRCMKAELCLDTFCEYITLSLMFKEDELLELAIDFFSRNMIHILETVEWQIFLKDRSSWANQILIRGLRLLEARIV